MYVSFIKEVRYIKNIMTQDWDSRFKGIIYKC